MAMMTKLIRARRPIFVTMVLALAAPAMAQTATVDKAVEARLRKLEAEVAALQRQVFPGGDGKYFAPQVQPSTAATAPVGTPAASAVTDILTRMDALESQVQKLTAQQEENTNKINKLEARVATLEAAAAPPPQQTLTDPAPTSLAPANTAPASTVTVTKPAQSAPTPATTKPAATASKPAATAPSPQRVAAVQKIEKPQTNDPGEDEYTYGFRLWDAKFYPEAEQQLKLFLQKYPKHSRASYARNLLGRAYLDEGNFDEAGSWFYQNYKADKAGERAPDSLLYLAEAMVRKKDNNRACIALAQFVDEYPAIAQGRLRSQYDGLLGKVKCN